MRDVSSKIRRSACSGNSSERRNICTMRESVTVLERAANETQFTLAVDLVKDALPQPLDS